MRVYYSCDNCGEFIDAVEVDALDETRFGFDCLTAEERQAIVRYDEATHAFYVQSLCDSCITALGFGVEPPAAGKILLH